MSERDDQDQERIREAAADGILGGETREAAERLERKGGRAFDPEGEEPVTLEEVRLRRKNGELQPLRARTVFEGVVIEFLPLTWGDRKQFPVRDKPIQQFTDDERLDLVRTKLTSPDLSGLSEDEIREELDWNFIDDAAMTIVANSRLKLRSQLPSFRELETDAEGKE